MKSLVFPDGIDAKEVLSKLMGQGTLDALVLMGAYLADSQKQLPAKNNKKEATDLLGKFWPLVDKILTKHSEEIEEAVVDKIKNSFLLELRSMAVEK